MSQINKNTAQNFSHNQQPHHLRDKDTLAHRLLQLIHRQEETRRNTLPRKTHHSTALPRGGIHKSIHHRQILLRAAPLRGETPRSTLHLPTTKDGRRLFPRCILPTIGVDVSVNEGKKRTVEKPQTQMNLKHFLGKRTCTLRSLPPSFVPPSTTLNERAPQAMPHPRNHPLRVVHQMGRGCRFMAPSYRPWPACSQKMSPPF